MGVVFDMWCDCYKSCVGCGDNVCIEYGWAIYFLLFVFSYSIVNWYIWRE